MTAILDAFGSGQEYLRLEEITERTDLPRSTAYRLMSQLVDLQWLVHTSQGFRLGPRSYRLWSHTTSYEEVRGAASAALSELHVATGGVVHLGVLEGGAVHYVDKVGGAAAPTIPSRVGARLDVTQTVCGLALLASLPPEEADAVIRIPVRGTSIPSLARPDHYVHNELYRVRQRNGLAFSPGAHCDMGISARAAPVVGPSGPVAAISIAARRHFDLQRIAPMVLRAALRTAQAMATTGQAQELSREHTRSALPR